MGITLTFEDFEPVAFILESRVEFLHSFKTAARELAQSREDSRVFEAYRKKLAFKVNNYSLPLMASFGKMPDAQSKSKLLSLITQMTFLYDGRFDATREEILHHSDAVISSYESLVGYLQAKNPPQQSL